MPSPPAQDPDSVTLGAGSRRLGLLIALLATLVPVVGLVVAGYQARDAVIERVLVGQAATAQAVAVNVQSSWQRALVTARAAPESPGLQDALSRGDDALLQRSVQSIATGSVFTAVAAYDPSGVQWAGAGPPFDSPLPRGLGPERIGPPVVTGADSLVQVLEPILSGGRQVGTLRLQLSYLRLMPDLQSLRYGRTGTTSLVAADSRLLLTPDAISRGRSLTSPAGRALAAAHRAGSVRLYSPRYHTRLIANYQPVPGTDVGVLTRQYESEAFATADRLQRHLRVAAIGALLLGLALVAGGFGLLRRYRRGLDARSAEYRALVDRSRDIIARFDADRRVLFVSPAVTEVLGHLPGEALGRDPLELVHVDDRDRFVAALQGHREYDSVTQVVRMLHRAGHDVWVEMTTVVDRSSDGSVLAYNGVTRDISDRHRAQVEIADARDAALQASVSKSVFLANTSHELRTPLNGILGLTEVLLRTPLNDVQRSYAQTVKDSGRGLLVILNDLLDLAKIEAGGLELERVPFTLAAAVQRAVAPFRPLADAAAVALEVDLDPRLPMWVSGDPTRFGQVLANLVSNAVKFTPSGRIRVVVRPADVGGETVEVLVSDTGIGIAPAALGLIFESFTQADSSTTRRFGGTGLGLAVSRQLSELQGGTLELDSELDVGSTFRLQLPLPAVAAPVPRRAADAPAGTTALHVLVAEDNEVNQLVARTLLEQLGHVVAVVSDGQAAVHAVLATDAHYDLVLMDCQMPVLDGYDATRLIRAGRSAGRHTPVVGLSAGAMQLDRERGLAAGMDRYLTKPIVLEELEEALADLARGRVR